ncbi:MAG: MerR family transcriptional regulator [Candidatus Didemnitutus sp.]|nr:MerR family transcriptional regulator [Candidatus Didemnitutus sp.]
MTTIRQLAAEFGLTRSTLLYYDRIGLLRPDYRTSSGYRLYNAADRARLAAICRYRMAGLPLARIATLLDDDRRPRSAGSSR